MTPKKKILLYIPSLVGGGAEKVVYDIIRNADHDKYEYRVFAHDYSGVYAEKIGAEYLVHVPTRGISDIASHFFDRVSLRLTKGRWKLSEKLKIFVRKKELHRFLEALDMNDDKFAREKATKLFLSKGLTHFRKAIECYQPDLICSHLLYANSTAYVSSLLHSGRGFPAIVAAEHTVRHKHIAESNATDEDKAFWHKLAEATYKAVTVTVCVSDGIKQDLIDSYGVSPASLITIYNGVARGDSNHVGKNRDKNFILSVGRLVKQKQQDQIIQAYAKSGIYKDFDLVILGEGSELESLVRLTEKLNIKKHVFFEGFCDQADSFYSKASCFVFSSAYEGFGLVLVEALANGCPVVSYDCDYGPGEIIKSPEHGVLVPLNRIDLLAEAMIKVVYTDRRTPKSDAKRMAYAQKFSISNMISGYEQCFESVLQA